MGKRIDNTAIAIGKALPLNAARLGFMQDNVEENIDRIIKSLINYTTGQVVILWGCVISGAPGPGAITMTAGAIYYNGLAYQVDSAIFTTTGSQIPVWTKIQTQDASDPATMSDSSPANVANITKFVLVAGPVGGSGVTGYVCDYNSSVVIDFLKSIDSDWISHTVPSSSVSINDPSGSTFGSCSIVYKQSYRDVTMQFILQFTSTVNDFVYITFPAPIGASNSVFHRSVCSIDNVTTQSSWAGRVTCSQSIGGVEIDSVQKIGIGSIIMQGEITYKKATPGLV